MDNWGLQTPCLDIWANKPCVPAVEKWYCEGKHVEFQIKAQKGWRTAKDLVRSWQAVELYRCFMLGGTLVLRGSFYGTLAAHDKTFPTSPFKVLCPDGSLTLAEVARSELDQQKHCQLKCLTGAGVCWGASGCSFLVKAPVSICWTLVWTSSLCCAVALPC